MGIEKYFSADLQVKFAAALLRTFQLFEITSFLVSIMLIPILMAKINGDPFFVMMPDLLVGFSLLLVSTQILHSKIYKMAVPVFKKIRDRLSKPGIRTELKSAMNFVFTYTEFEGPSFLTGTYSIRAFRTATAAIAVFAYILTAQS